MTKRKETDELLPEYARHITEASDPVFRTCEVLTRIENLFGEDGVTPLGYEDKIHILKSLKKKLNMSLSGTYLISRSQGDPNRIIMNLIDEKMEEFGIKRDTSPNFPKIHERRSWWR